MERKKTRPQTYQKTNQHDTKMRISTFEHNSKSPRLLKISNTMQTKRRNEEEKKNTRFSYCELCLNNNAKRL